MRKLTLPDSGAAQDGDRRVAPSAQRNIAPIAAVLDTALPKEGVVLEIASGTGQHVAHLAQRFAGLTWQPTDANPETLPSIRAWCKGAANVQNPVVLNACQPGWSQHFRGFNAICLTNLLHLISTPEAETLMTEVAMALAPGGVFCLYGPFRQGGVLKSEGDKAFDASLKAQDPAIGYKEITWVNDHLRANGLMQIALQSMPAGNLMLITQRRDPTA